jgi:predicted nucleic acid-binding protein
VKCGLPSDAVAFGLPSDAVAFGLPSDAVAFGLPLNEDARILRSKTLTSCSSPTIPEWDALILAACLVNGVDRLYTEDFDAYPKLNGLEVINPFAVG